MSARLHASAFVVLCMLGVVAAVGLTVREVVRTAPIALHVDHTSRTGLATTVTVSVRNRTSTTRCLTVHIAARDRTGHDLATGTMATDLSVPGHASRTVQAELTLTARQYAEDLHAFYPSQRPCAAIGEG